MLPGLPPTLPRPRNTGACGWCWRLCLVLGACGSAGWYVVDPTLERMRTVEPVVHAFGLLVHDQAAHS